VFSATLIVSAVALIGLSWDDIWRVCGSVYGECVERSAGAMILTIGSIAAIGWGVGIVVRIRRRPVDPSGSSRYVWARCPVRTRGDLHRSEDPRLYV
jgi:hypothetical protein